MLCFLSARLPTPSAVSATHALCAVLAYLHAVLRYEVVLKEYAGFRLYLVHVFISTTTDNGW